MKPGQLHRSPHRRHVWAVVLAEHDGVNRMICLGCGKPKDEDVSRRGRPQHTAPMKRRARRDPVTPELRIAVLERDGGRCMAPSLGGRWEDCWGRLTLEHVKDELRLGVRASSDLRHLLTLCQGHTEDGRKAGFQWNTNAENRALVRRYLGEVAP